MGGDGMGWQAMLPVKFRHPRHGHEKNFGFGIHFL
jgi:hypothetical protein